MSLWFVVLCCQPDNAFLHIVMVAMGSTLNDIHWLTVPFVHAHEVIALTIAG